MRVANRRGDATTGWRRWSARWMRPAAVASLIANIGLVVTGGAVRLTGSGLGCPTWPECSPGSLVPHGQLGLHGVIEFGNRLLTFVLIAIALLTFAAALGYGRRRVVWLTVAMGLGIPAQAVVGGITVLTGLNPWVVAGHLLVSMAIICPAVLLLRTLREGDGPAEPTVPRPVVWSVRAVFAATWAVLYLGTVVTGSGPHAGDVNAPRNGLDPEQMSQLHADLVFLLVGLTVATLLALVTVGAPRRARTAAVTLLAIELAQGAVGFTQYFTGLPELLVGVHMLGAALTAAAATWLLLGVRRRPELPPDPLVAAQPGSASRQHSASRQDALHVPRHAPDHAQMSADGAQPPEWP